jgi:hypothetical protein
VLSGREELLQALLLLASVWRLRIISLLLVLLKQRPPQASQQQQQRLHYSRLRAIHKAALAAVPRCCVLSLSSAAVPS